MGLCIASFLSMFTFVFGIALMIILPSSMSIVIEQMIPLPMAIMVVGFILAVIIILVIRSMGNFLCEIDNKTLFTAFNGLCKFALIVSVLLCAIQAYLRITYNEWGFFVCGENLKSAFENPGFENIDFLLFFSSLISTLFLGLPLYVIAFFNGDFSQYVTVTHTYLSDGSSYESGRSEAYVSIAQFIIMALLLTIPFVGLGSSIISYLFPAGFAAILYARKGKKQLITALIIFGAIALGLTIFSVLPHFGIAY